MEAAGNPAKYEQQMVKLGKEQIGSVGSRSSGERAQNCEIFLSHAEAT